MNDLASAVRRLVAATVTNAAPAEVIRHAAAALSAEADALERHIPADVPSITQIGPVWGEPSGFRNSMLFDSVVGPLNPLAAPVHLTFHEGHVLGEVSFGTPYEGPPGCVHGGVLAAMFDIVLSAANVAAGAAGPTKKLELRFRKPTRLNVPVEVDAHVQDSDGRSIVTVGRLTQGEVVTVEAVGTFVVADPERLNRLHETNKA